MLPTKESNQSAVKGLRQTRAKGPNHAESWAQKASETIQRSAATCDLGAQGLKLRDP